MQFPSIDEIKNLVHKNQKSEVQQTRGNLTTGLIVMFTVVTYGSQLFAETFHTSDLGWTEGQDMTTKFSALLNEGGVQPGDELVLDHTYEISGSHQLPDDFTLSAMTGAGFEVTDAADPTMNQPLLKLGDKNSLLNLMITYLNTPELGPTGEVRGETFTARKGIRAIGKSNIRIERCRFEGSIGTHLMLVDCSRPTVINSHMIGGHYPVILNGAVTEPVFRYCLIEKCQGDAIKTVSGPNGDMVVRGALVENCVFQDNLRDGIDTTGGFDDSVVRNCVFRRLGISGMDIKSHYQSKAGTIEGIMPENIGILIEGCLFHVMPNAFVFTTSDGDYKNDPQNPLLTADNMAKYAPHDIDINDCVVGPSEEGGNMRAFLLKDAYDIRYKNLRLSDEGIVVTHIASIGGTSSLSLEAAESIDHSITGNILDTTYGSIDLGETTVPFACGPMTQDQRRNREKEPPRPPSRPVVDR